MANPNPSPPPPEHRFQKGQSGNPGGYSKARRAQAAILKLMDEMGDDRDIAVAIYAKATGRKSLLKDQAEEEGKRSPEFTWWKELVDRVDGPITQSIEAEVKTDERRVVVLPPKRGDGGPAGPPDGVPGD